MRKRIVLLIVIVLLLISGVCIFKKYVKIKDDRKKFTFWTIQLKPIYEKQINNIIDKFEKRHPEYKVVWVDIPIQEAQKRTLASILSSTPPDLINLNPEFSHILAQRNTLEHFSYDELWQFHPNLIDKLKYKGRIYGLPFYATSPVTVYNKEIYNKCVGSDFIKTYDELYLKSEKIKTCSKIAPFASSLNENDTLYKILNKYNVQKFSAVQEQNLTLRVYSMFNDMYKKGYIPKDSLTINHREMIEKYMSNQALVIVAGSNFIKMIKQNAPDIYSKSAIAPQLVGSNGKYDISLMNLVIPKKSKNKELAREFAFELTNKDNQIELAKLTNVLPANKYALSDDYFRVCSSDIEQKSRCESAKQLNNAILSKVEIKDKKALNEILNKTLEEILLNEKSCFRDIEARFANLFPQLNLLLEQN